MITRGALELVLNWVKFWLEEVLLLWLRFGEKRCGEGERGGEGAACISMAG